MKPGAKFLAAGVMACALLARPLTLAAQPFLVGPNHLSFTVQAETVANSLQPQLAIQSVQIMGPAGTSFQFTGVQPVAGEGNAINFVVVAPSSGVVPATVGIALNPSIVPYMKPGSYVLLAGFGQAGQALAGVEVTLTLLPPAPPTVASVVSTASYQPTISPGELVSIFGANIGTPPISSQFGGDGLYPTTLGNTTVAFNGILAPLLYVSTGQINAVVPYGVAGQKTVNVVVTHDSQAAPAFPVTIADTSPGIFTATQTGTGQGAILNAFPNPYQPTANSTSNPSPKGSAIIIYATGAGVLTPAVPDGSILLNSAQPAYVPAASVSLTIGGQPAFVFYASVPPFQVSGMLQINAIVPDGVASGSQPVVLTIGQNNNAQQQITVAVQ